MAAVAAAGDELGHHPRVTLGDGVVDIKAISTDAVYREPGGTEHVLEWVPQRDVDLAHRITDVAADHAARADPVSITTVELALDTAHAADISPVWAVLLTGSVDARGRGSIAHDVRVAALPAAGAPGPHTA